MGPAAPDSPRTFPDGAHYRIEIASTEGPACLEAVVEAAAQHDLHVHRVSQGSGVGMLTDTELDDMNAIAREHGIEVSLFARPTAGWTTSASARAERGAIVAGAVHGVDGLRAAMTDIVRAADHGFRSVLISDLGLLAAFAAARRDGALPADMQAKVSVLLPVANPLTARVLSDLGADTLNVVTDLSVLDLSQLRSATAVPLDVYVDAPDDLGGFVRHHEASSIAAAASPAYLKLGLRNAPDLYPSGSHLQATAVALSRERVRRARLVLDRVRTERPELRTSGPGAPGLAVPVTS